MRNRDLAISPPDLPSDFEVNVNCIGGPQRVETKVAVTIIHVKGTTDIS